MVGRVAEALAGSMDASAEPRGDPTAVVDRELEIEVCE
jgi:hypothetical protein